ncbi:MAG TPA: methyltransferase domain-containing protein [Pyrinomonadaceae bacterium]|nr:methyltransferase domain-containing protein [Pyrinomonadaceae bacterium]
MSRNSFKDKAKILVPAGARSWLRAQQKGWKVWPPVGTLKFGSLGRVNPISRHFGFDRGNCIDRFYIEDFLSTNASDIKGRVLEIADNEYTKQFGGNRVTQSDVLHVQGSPRATIVADLTRADNVPSDSFDCMIITQTLQFIYDTRAAIATMHRLLKPGGVLLTTFPGISQISRVDMDQWGEYWRFTTMSAKQLFAETFGDSVTVQAYGNVFAAVAFLHGLAQEDIDLAKLKPHDADYEVLVTVRAVKQES